jgi:hypothetical protein
MSSDIIITEYQLQLIFLNSCCKLHFANLLEILWNSFSKTQKQKWDSYRLCSNHVYSSNDFDVNDGPTPNKLDCPECKQGN